MVAGCTPTCEDVTPENGVCSNKAGCCQADVPKGTYSYYSYFNDGINQDSRCSYIVVMEKAAFNFNTSYFNSTVFNDTYNGIFPLVANWQIESSSCKEAKTNTSSYACVSTHSACVDSTTNGPGYRCVCSGGYRGNPYKVPSLCCLVLSPSVPK